MSKGNLINIINGLTKISKEIKSYEFLARQALYENNDQEEYTKQLKLKAHKLISLPKLFDEDIKSLSIPLQAMIKDKIGGMAFSAEKSIKLDSIFYMSALLYPENHQEGQENDLEGFIQELEDVNSN